MTWLDFLPIVLVVLIVGGAVFYIVREKRKGKKCIGCPYSDSCAYKNKSGCCASHRNKKEKNGLQK